MGAAKPKNKWLSLLADGFLGGMMIGIGGIVNLSCDNRYLGAFFFSLGLFSILLFGFGLYTGKVGYILDNKPSYLGEVFFTLLANAIGVAVTAGLMTLTRFAGSTAVNGMDVTLRERAQSTIAAKFDDSLLSALVLAFFCGLMMYLAVVGSKRCKEQKNYPAALFVTVLPIMVFILCGFNHCVADLFYYFLAGCPRPGRAVCYFLMAIIGNLLGGVLIPALKRLSRNP